MIEREGALASAARVLEGARAGRGGSLFVVAEPGLGKTSVLAWSRERADGFRVGAGVGDPMEHALPYGLIDQALEGLGVAPAGDGGTGGEARAARLHQVLRWLGANREEPVLFLLDDLHWADGDSLALLSSLARRVSGLPVALVATLRPWPPAAAQVCHELSGQGWGTIERLAPLSQAAAARLLAERLGRGVPAAVAERACAAAGGNPLLLEQVAFAMSRGEEPDWGGGALERTGLLLSRFAGVPAEGLECARAASVLGVHFRPDVACELAGLDEAQRAVALEALWHSRLVREAERGQLAFVHPLFRQALYEDLGAPLRVALHARAFRLLLARGLETEAAGHALPGGLIGDAGAAALLQRVGRQALDGGAVATAMETLETAMELAGEPAPPQLLLDLAEALVTGGDQARARIVCERLLAGPALPVELRLLGQRWLAEAMHGVGEPEQAARVSKEVTSLAERAPDAVAVAELIISAQLHANTEGPGAGLPLARRARERAAGTDTATRMIADGAWGVLATYCGDPDGLPALLPLVDAAEREPRTYAFDGPLGWMSDTATMATVLRTAERFEQALDLIDRALPVVEHSGAWNSLAALLRARADVLVRQGRIADAFECLEADWMEGALTGTGDAFRRVTVAAFLQAMDRLEESDALARPVESLNSGRHWVPLLRLWDLRGERSLREGRIEEACRLYERAEELALRIGLREPCHVPWARHAVAAHLAAGRLDDVERLLRWLEDVGGPLSCRWPKIAAAVGRAGLAARRGDDAEAEAGYQAALDLHEQVHLPLEKVETLLDHGAFLVERGEAQRARRALAEAGAIAEACGAAWLARHAAARLLEAGGRPRRRTRAGTLTPRERRVAELAAGGLTNQEIAQQLVVSTRTVETHLEHVYAKLGIASRRQLILMMS